VFFHIRVYRLKEPLMAKIRMYTTPSCSDCRAAKRFLVGKGIAFEEINIEEVPGAAEVVVQATGGKRSVPTFDIDGRFVTFSPFSLKKLSEALGLSQEA
jgi:mycoredoxin